MIINECQLRRNHQKWTSYCTKPNHNMKRNTENEWTLFPIEIPGKFEDISATLTIGHTRISTVSYNGRGRTRCPSHHRPRPRWMPNILLWRHLHNKFHQPAWTIGWNTLHCSQCPTSSSSSRSPNFEPISLKTIQNN